MTSCIMSERTVEKSAGINGGFEVSKRGLPVNWLFYTPKTVPDADFKIVLDTIEFKEGRQSIRYDVIKCSDSGEWRSPGFTREFFELEGQGTYLLTFWVKNNGAKYRITAGGVKAKGSAMKTLLESDKKSSGWEKHEFEVNVPETMWLRVQLNLLSPGTFWIDDINIHKK